MERHEIKDHKGRVVGVEVPGGHDLIAMWMLEGKYKPETPADEILVPACFSLGCIYCDIDGPGTRVEAEAGGWTSISFEPDMLSLNYVGVCPECKKEGR